MGSASAGDRPAGPTLEAFTSEDCNLAAKIQGKVTSLNPRGHAVTDIPVESLSAAPTDERVSIHCDGHVTACIFPADHQQPEMTFLALKGESGFLELTLVGDDIAAFLGIRPGCDVTVRW